MYFFVCHTSRSQGSALTMSMETQKGKQRCKLQKHANTSATNAN